MGLRDKWFTVVHVAYDLFLKLNPRKLAAAAVIADDMGRVLVLRSRYGDVLLLPGGGLDRREHLDEGLVRECQEELGLAIQVERLTGMYYHADTSVYQAAFRCRLSEGAAIRLSHEHTEYSWLLPEQLPDRLGRIARDALSGAPETVVHTFR